MVTKFLPTISPMRCEDEFPDRVFTAWDVIVICFLVGHGEGQEHLARQYDVNVQTIHRLVTKISYRSWDRQDVQLEDLYQGACLQAGFPTDRLQLELAYRVLRLWRDDINFQTQAPSDSLVNPQP